MMGIAADGKPFDIDNMSELRPDEVEVIQFLRPDGRRRRMASPVGEDYVEKAKDMVISSEAIVGIVVLYVRYKHEDAEKEITEIAHNGPGPREPTKILKELIDRKVVENAGRAANKNKKDR